MLALLWRFASEAARESAREYADDAWRAPPPPRLERPNYAPLLIEAVAAALEEFDAPPVEAPALLESPLAPPVELTLVEPKTRRAPRRRCNCPPDMLAALAEAA